MTTLSLTINKQRVQKALDIPHLTHREAGELAEAEAERVLALLQTLAGDDWNQPTDCTEWTVRQMVAHLAGAVAAQSSWAEFKRQGLRNPYLKETDVQIDAINRLQVEDRAAASPAELVAEFREKAPKALRTRRRLPWLLRRLPVPFGPPLGTAPIGYLTDTILTRDQWMHRLDIARATGREMVLTPAHDGRIVALVIRDLARQLRGQFEGRTTDLLLTGQAGGAFRFGRGSHADVVIEMDLATFNRLASGRLPAEEALAQATIEGDRESTLWFLSRCDVPY